MCGILHVDPSPTAPTQAQRQRHGRNTKFLGPESEAAGNGPAIRTSIANLVDQWKPSNMNIEDQLLVELNPYLGGQNPHL